MNFDCFDLGVMKRAVKWLPVGMVLKHCNEYVAYRRFDMFLNPYGRKTKRDINLM